MPSSKKKVCPPGKVLNATTNRCNKKKCDPSKVLNLETNRCVAKKLRIKTKTKVLSKVLSKVLTKVCPLGKVVNPKTGRCIKDKSKSKSKSVVKHTTPIYKNGDRWKPNPFGKKNSCRIKRDNRGSNNLNQTMPPYDPSYCVGRKVKASNGDTYETVDSKKTFTDAFGTSYVQKWAKLNETCPLGKVVNPKTGRCIKVKKTKKFPPVSKSKSQPQPKGTVLWDVKKQGVMLAHTFKDPTSGKIRTAPKDTSQAPNGWFLSEKYDGYRAIWDGSQFRSRNGLVFEAPAYFKEWMPKDHALDGELFMGREKFEKCGIFRRKNADCDEWKRANVTYQIFDSPTMNHLGFEDRTKSIKKLINELCKKRSGKCPLKMTKQIKVKNEDEVYKHFNALVSKGAEGVMLRAPGSPYVPSRSSYLLKVKQLFDAECKIIGYKSGTGKYKDLLGAFECQLVKNSAIKFTISGMNDTIRQNYKTSHPKGTVVTFTYMGLSERGVPRHPNYLRKR